MACSVCDKDQHSLRESADCDYIKNHKGKDTDKGRILKETGK